MHPMFGVSLGIVALGIGSFVTFGTDFRVRLAPIAQAVAGEPVTTSGQQLQTVKLRVENMDCAGCSYILRRTLTGVEGVTAAKVSYEQKTAIVTFDPARCGVAQLVAATAGIGFPSTAIE